MIVSCIYINRLQRDTKQTASCICAYFPAFSEVLYWKKQMNKKKKANFSPVNLILTNFPGICNKQHFGVFFMNSC